MPDVHVKGKKAGENSPVIIVIRPGDDPDWQAETIEHAQSFIADVTGRIPATRIDGTGTATITAGPRT
jgi:hypothetical protein